MQAYSPKVDELFYTKKGKKENKKVGYCITKCVYSEQLRNQNIPGTTQKDPN